MKTKHYLLVSAAVAIGIIAGVLISTGIMRNQQRNFVQTRMEMQNGNFSQGGFQNMRGGGQYHGQGMNRGQMNNMGFMNRNANFNQHFIRQLDLTNEQQEKMDIIMASIYEEREQMNTVRESRWATTKDEIQAVLNEDQIRLMDKMMSPDDPPMIQRVLNQLNLTNDQEEKINTILDRNREMSENMWKTREEQHAKKMEDIKSILTEEQIEQLENLQSKRGRNGQRGMRQRGRM
ncbi:MAG: hypothetical protein K8R68_05515 [Bacteroidales bacterium]|nr:hypothetical protein [Bacteroidales bacterium]